MMTNTSYVEEQLVDLTLVDLTEAIAGLTKCMQNEDDRIDKLTYMVKVLIEGESSHAPSKHPEVQEIDPHQDK